MFKNLNLQQKNILILGAFGTICAVLCLAAGYVLAKIALIH